MVVEPRGFPLHLTPSIISSWTLATTNQNLTTFTHYSLSHAMSGHQQRTRPRFPSLWHLQCVATMAFLAFCGLVSLQNAAVVALSTLYLLLLSTYSFPRQPSPDDTPVFPASRVLPAYVLFAGVAGLLLPALYILHGIYEGDRRGAAAAAPHLFLLASQVVMEGVTFAAGFSIPVRAFVPVFYNSWRISAVFEWARSEMMTSSVMERGGSSQQGRVYFGKGLALLNAGLWSYNLFGFLLPVYLPKAFKRYYSPTNAGPKVE